VCQDAAAAAERRKKMILEGTIDRKGCRVASGVIAHYSREFARHKSELANLYPGTINVDVDSHTVIDFLRIDFRTPPIGELPEVEFVRVGFEFPIGNILDANAWIYQPYGFHWGERKRRNFVEIFIERTY